MTVFQLLMLGASAFFAYKIYEHIQTLKDEQEGTEDNSTRGADTFSVFSPESLLERADEAYEEEDYSKALALLTEANAKDKNNIEIIFKRAYMLHKLNELDEAVSGFKEALEIDQVPFIHNALASVYREKGEFVSARMQLNASLDKDSKNPATYFNYGNLLVDMNSKEEAIEMYEKALAIDPELEAARVELEKLKEAQDEDK